MTAFGISNAFAQPYYVKVVEPSDGGLQGIEGVTVHFWIEEERIDMGTDVTDEFGYASIPGMQPQDVWHVFLEELPEGYVWDEPPNGWIVNIPEDDYFERAVIVEEE